MSKHADFDTKQLRAIGHKLKPVVTVAANGVSDTVLAELERALDQHELIKVKLAVGGREARAAVTDEVCERTGATRVQSIGNIILILRRAAQPNPRRSNLGRPID